VGAGLWHADGQTDRQHDKANSCIFAILWMHLKQDQIQYSIFYSTSYTDSEDKVHINKKAPNTKPKFLTIPGSRNITRKVSQICGTYTAMYKWQIHQSHKSTQSLRVFAKVR